MVPRLAVTLLLAACAANCSSSDASDLTGGPGGGGGSDAAGDTSASDSASDGTASDAASGSDTASPKDAAADTGAKCLADPDKKGLTSRTAAGNPYVSYVPAAYTPGTPTPMVVALHGAGDTAANYLQYEWKTNADARGFIVIAPEGTYPYSGGFAWNVSDEALVLAAIDDVQRCYGIDSKRIILNGFSAGGVMAYFIGLDRADVFGGIAIASATLDAAEGANGGSLIPAAWKIPVSHFHGTTDANFPIAGAISGKDRLIAAGHPFYWHSFVGGHTTNAGDALVMFDDLKTSTAP